MAPPTPKLQPPPIQTYGGKHSGSPAQQAIARAREMAEQQTALNKAHAGGKKRRKYYGGAIGDGRTPDDPPPGNLLVPQTHTGIHIAGPINGNSNSLTGNKTRSQGISQKVYDNEVPYTPSKGGGKKRKTFKRRFYYGKKKGRIIKIYPHKIYKRIGRHKSYTLWKTTKKNLPGKTYHGKFYKTRKEARKTRKITASMRAQWRKQQKRCRKTIQKRRRRRGGSSNKRNRTKKKGKNYFVHDNGGRPFQVTISGKKISIYEQPRWREGGVQDFTKLVKTYPNAQKIFIGKDMKLGKKFDGNSILAQLSKNRYLYIGGWVYEFSTKSDEITAYYSQVGNSDVPYPVAVGKNNVYFMLEAPNKRPGVVPRSAFPEGMKARDWENAYSLFYNGTKETRSKQKELLPLIKKAGKFLKVKIVQKRHW